MVLVEVAAALDLRSVVVLSSLTFDAWVSVGATLTCRVWVSDRVETPFPVEWEAVSAPLLFRCFGN